jgi:hypothetical protein
MVKANHSGAASFLPYSFTLSSNLQSFVAFRTVAAAAHKSPPKITKFPRKHFPSSRYSNSYSNESSSSSSKQALSSRKWIFLNFLHSLNEKKALLSK